MRILIVLLVALAACATNETAAEQALCTIQDQEAGTCPPTSWIVQDAVDYAEAQYGAAPTAQSWAQCERRNDGWRCTVRIDWSWGWTLTTCTANGVCWTITQPGRGAAPTDTSYCTEGDPDCGDPGGGGGGGPDVAEAAESYASSVVASYQQQGYQLLHRTRSVCEAGERSCVLTLDFGSFRIHVTCFDFGPPQGVACWSRTS